MTIYKNRAGKESLILTDSTSDKAPLFAVMRLTMEWGNVKEWQGMYSHPVPSKSYKSYRVRYYIQNSSDMWHIRRWHFHTLKLLEF